MKRTMVSILAAAGMLAAVVCGAAPAWAAETAEAAGQLEEKKPGGP